MNESKLTKLYKKDILKIYKLYKSIYDNLNIDINIEKIDLNANLPSFYKIYLLFSKTIIKKEYMNHISNYFTFDKTKLNKEVSQVADLLFSFNKNDNANTLENANINLTNKEIDKLNNVFEGRTPILKKILCDLLYYNFDLLPNEIKNLSNITFFIQHKLLYNNFISFDIIESIKKMKYIIKVNYNKDKLFHLYCYNKKEALFLKKNVLKKMTTRILFLSNYFNVKKIPFLNIYYTDKNKTMNYKLNKKVIYTPKEINSAATDNTNLIMIWRREELLKSILHECIHFYNLDIKSSTLNNYYNNYFKKILNINQKNVVNISESYTEMNACFLNCIFYINENEKKTIKNEKIINVFNKNLKKEIDFSIFQTSKILQFQSYKKFQDILIKNKDTEINQTTNLISYHIIKSSFLYYIDKIYNNNSKNKLELKFNIYSNDKLKNFEKLIKYIFNNKKESEWVKLVNKNIKSLKKKTKKKTKSKYNIKSLKMVFLS
jgi:hypothetical protein